ncbi:MAG TPA: hypothetical protein VF659_12040, partial [Pyrinomonadaceae bacterium]
RIALRVASSVQQAHQLFIFMWDKVWDRRTQFFDNRADSSWRGQRVDFALTASCSSQSLKTAPEGD